VINPGRWRSPLAALALSLLGGLSQFAMAADLFDGTAARAFVSGEVLKPGSTVGGYPVYEGDGAWRILEVAKVTTNTMGVSYGSAVFEQFTDGVFLAHMVTSVNLNQSGQAFYTTGDNCGGVHQVRVNKATAGRGDSAWDNCLTIDARDVKVQKKPVTVLHLKVTITREGSRYYQTDLFLNPMALGLENSQPADWDVDALDATPARKAMMGKIVAFGKQLQSATERAMEWSSPKDAFKDVGTLRSLKAD